MFNLRETEIEFCNDDWVRDYALSLSNTANKFIQVNIGLQFVQACVPAGFDAGFCEPADRAIAVEFITFPAGF